MKYRTFDKWKQKCRCVKQGETAHYFVDGVAYFGKDQTVKLQRNAVEYDYGYDSEHDYQRDLDELDYMNYC